MFGTNIEVELNSSWDYRAYNGMSIHNTNEEIELGEIENENNAENNAEKNVGENAGENVADNIDRYEKNGNRKAIASTCNVEINDIICTGLFTTKYMEEEYE